MMRFFVFLFVFFNAPAFAEDSTENQDFTQWRDGFYARAVDSGIDKKILDESLSPLSEPNERIIALDQKQPEGKSTFSEYINKIVSADRAAKGTELLWQHADLLKKTASKYGVDARIIVSLWGVETYYGKITGGFPVIEALATLSFEGRRRDFFESELINALHILQDGHITNDQFIGSWAGAMGQCQFMPSSFANYAVDGDGDGHRDIWNNYADIFASIANYLKEHGWQSNQHWGRAVKLPENFTLTETIAKPLSYWRSVGIKESNGEELSDDKNNNDITATLVIMDNDKTQAFLLYDNADVLKKWNKSSYFVLSVGLLADAI